jgi:DNA polymerase-1
VYLIDAMSYIFRAYHARTPQAFTSPSGEPTQAVFLFNNMLRKLLREHAPDYVAVAFESGGPTVRDEIFEDYKAQRPSAPDDLVAQIEPIKRLCQALRLKLLEHEGYEADDVIATLAEQARGKGLDAVVVTSDKDMLQLVRTKKGATVQVFSPTREKFLDEAAVEEYFGVPPKKVVEVVALMGDAVDNIPGAKGIGEKGARDLITRFGSAGEAMKHADEVKQKKYREALQQQQDQIRLSRQLATLHADLPIPFDLKSLQLQEPDTEQLVALYTEMGFTSLLKEHLPAAVAVPKDVEYRDLEKPAELKKFLSATGQQPLAVWCETSGDSPADLKLTALAFSAKPGAATVAPLGNEREAWLAIARAFLEDEQKAKIVHDSKTATLALAAEEMELRGPIEDTALYSYLLQPTTAKHRLEDVAARRLNRPLSGSVAEKADTVQRLAAPLRTEVKQQKLQR